MKRLGCTIWQPSKKLIISHKNLYFLTLVIFLHCPTEFPLICRMLPSESLAMKIMHIRHFFPFNSKFPFLSVFFLLCCRFGTSTTKVGGA